MKRNVQKGLQSAKLLRLNLLDIPINHEDLLYSERVSRQSEINGDTDVIEKAEPPMYGTAQNKCVRMGQGEKGSAARYHARKGSDL